MKNFYAGPLLSLALIMSCPAMAMAGESSQDLRWNAGDLLVRGRAIGIVPDESSTITPVGGKADVSNEIVPELDFTYFFTRNLAAELILATSKHDATARNVGGVNVDAGSVWVLPPTLTLQYHFTRFEQFKPYIGAGVNYTFYYNEKGGALTNVTYKDAFGVALQIGVDVPIDERWSWNLDVKKLFVDADAKWSDGAVRGDIALDPWIIGVGAGYRF